ncbi:MAG: gliding motility-associated C-terminal domain-containing protein [Bacteroidota bacterium]
MTNLRLAFRALALCILLCCFAQVSGQSNEGNIWYFGEGHGLNFNPGADLVIADANAMATFEGCAIICDDLGEVLFYTNGGGRPNDTPDEPGTIWNRNDGVLYDMNGLEGGGWSSQQSSIIIPVPEQTDRYFLFTMDEGERVVTGTPKRGLSVFEIDMTANGGLGAVVDYREAIVPEVSEGLAVCRHSNGVDYWLALLEPNQIRYNIYQISTLGFFLASSVAAPFPPGFSQANPAPLRFSPDGQHFYAPGALYSFNPGNGQLSDFKLIPNPFSYGVTFSPNSQYLYLYREEYEARRTILRYATKVPAPIETEEVISSYLTPRLGGQMQVAPDGNIYFVEADFFTRQTSVSVINCPNSLTPCVENDVASFPATFFNPVGLPNFTDHFFINNDTFPEIEVIIEATQDSICIGEPSTLTALAAEPGVTYRWSTGASTAAITVDQPGRYGVTVTDGCCNGGATEIELGIPFVVPELSIFGDTLLCQEDFTVLTAVAPDALTLRWSTGDFSPNLFVEESGTYTVTVTNACGRSNTGSVDVRFLDQLRPDFVAEVFDNPCFGDAEGAIELGFEQANPPYTFAWFDNQNNPLGSGSRIENLEVGEYRVDIRPLAEDCVFTYDFLVDQPAALEVLTSVVTTDCGEERGSRLEVQVEGGSPDYRYRYAADSAFVESSSAVLLPGNYIVTVLDANLCEQSSDPITIVASEVLIVELVGPTEPVAQGRPFQLEVRSNRDLSGAQLEWFPADAINCSDCPVVSTSLLEDTDYAVRVSFPDGCTLVAEWSVVADKTRRVYVPNAFSPNQDGQNETLRVYVGDGVNEVRQFRIFSRWGALLHDDPQLAWDGRTKGQPVQNGIYTWMAEVEFLDGEREVFSGDVLLVR